MYCGPLSGVHIRDFMARVSVDEPFAIQLRTLREDRGLSRSTLSHRTARAGEPGVSTDTITRLELDPRRVPTDATILQLGEALEATDDEFPAYALAKARALFDERVQRPSAAWHNLRRLRKAFDA